MKIYHNGSVDGDIMVLQSFSWVSFKNLPESQWLMESFLHMGRRLSYELILLLMNIKFCLYTIYLRKWYLMLIALSAIWIHPHFKFCCHFLSVSHSSTRKITPASLIQFFQTCSITSTQFLQMPFSCLESSLKKCPGIEDNGDHLNLYLFI